MKISTIGILTYFSCQFVIGQSGYGQNIKETAHILIADLIIGSDPPSGHISSHKL
jgi:hypothetical protein